MAAKYLYGVMRGGGVSKFGPIGTPEGAERVHLIGSEGVAAVVSDYRGCPFSELRRGELLRQLAIHQKVIETVMGVGTILPAKFGTVLPSRGALLNAVGCAIPRLTQALDKFEGMVQYEIAVTWEERTLLEEVAAQEEIAVLRRSAAEIPPERSLDLRVRIGRMLKESLDRRREELREQLIMSMGEHAVDRQANSLMGDEMVMNEAFLVTRRGRQQFLDSLDAADARFAGKLNFRCIGPLPPYSFATVEIVRPDPARLGEALQLLGLGEQVSVASVREAYRRLAASFHPDVNPSPEAAKLFPQLREAQALLVTCCSGMVAGDSPSEDNSFRITPKGLRRSYLVAVKRVAD